MERSDLFKMSKETSIKKLNRNAFSVGEMVTVYHYCRNVDNSITKKAYNAISKITVMK